MRAPRRFLGRPVGDAVGMRTNTANAPVTEVDGGFRARTSHSGEIELELELNPNDCRVGDQQCIAR